MAFFGFFSNNLSKSPRVWPTKQVLIVNSIQIIRLNLDSIEQKDENQSDELSKHEREENDMSFEILSSEEHRRLLRDDY